MIVIYGWADEIVGYKPDGKNIKTAESEAGRALLGLLLSRHGIDPSTAEIKTDVNGKPYVSGREDLHFNISHSKGFVVCAFSVGEGRVGVDAERLRDVLPRERQIKLAERFFSEKEKKALADGESFVNLWTKREAYLKMTGDGFARGIGEEIPENASFATFVADGFVISLCTEIPAETEFCEYKNDKWRNLK